MYQVVIDQPGELHPAALEYLNEFSLVSVPSTFEEAELVNLIQNADAVISWGNTKWTQELLAKAGVKLRTIAITGTGVDNINLAACKDKGVVVTNTPGVNANAVAEYTIGTVLCCLRNTFSARDSIKDATWTEAELYTGREIKHSVTGVVGLGNIGRRVGSLLHGFGAEVLGYDPMVSAEQAAESGITLLDNLEELCSRADVICSHVPLNQHTHHMIGKSCFDAMHSHVWLINMGRAPVVDEELLVSYLKAGKIAGYYTDVFPVEPPDLQMDLYRLEQVYATPHIAAMTDVAYRDMQVYAARNVKAVLDGQTKPLNIVV